MDQSKNIDYLNCSDSEISMALTEEKEGASFVHEKDSVESKSDEFDDVDAFDFSKWQQFQPKQLYIYIIVCKKYIRRFS